MPIQNRLYRATAVAMAWLLLALTNRTGASAVNPVDLVQNSTFVLRTADGSPIGYELHGDAHGIRVNNPRARVQLWGVALDSAGRNHQGEVSQIVRLDPSAGRWYRFSIRGLPQSHFRVEQNDLRLKVEFLGADATQYDEKAKPIYSAVEHVRRDLNINGDFHANGSVVWQHYTLDVYIPFPQVRRARLSVGFAHGAGDTAQDSAFDVTDFSFEKIDVPPGLIATPAAALTKSSVDHSTLIPLGGRWYYAAAEGETAAPRRFDYTNAARLLYHDSVYTAPFDGNMSAWLKAGYKDIGGNVVTHDQWIADNVTIAFDISSMVVHTHGLPNHPTGSFPGYRGMDAGSNPSYIGEQNATYYLPLNPTANSRHFVTDTANQNHALNMGAIGVAVNGVVFFNPFDANSEDVSNEMDLCCGHPTPFSLYHYHKYPICVNSPWSDEGASHSALIGFAFDGFPVYGPYESKDVMAKDLTGAHALNAFNMHYDAGRGWHYHVTPGRFPYIIGGYWGTVDVRDTMNPRGGGRRGMNGPGGNGLRGAGPNGGRPPTDGGFPPDF